MRFIGQHVERLDVSDKSQKTASHRPRSAKKRNHEIPSAAGRGSRRAASVGQRTKTAGISSVSCRNIARGSAGASPSRCHALANWPAVFLIVARLEAGSEAVYRTRFLARVDLKAPRGLRLKTMFDRRWIFLGMAIVVAGPLLAGWRFPVSPSPLTRTVFKTIDELPPNSKILMAMDYDPGSRPELGPMASGFTRQCAQRGHKLYFLTLWAGGGQMINSQIDILREEFPQYQEGIDYVNFGFQNGLEGVIKVITTDLRKQIPADVNGTDLRQIPMTKDLESVQQMDLIINVSAGTPGAREWVQFAATPFKMKMLAGSTGVQAPQLSPFVPDQLIGMLAALKGAAEYETILLEKYPDLQKRPSAQVAQRRMGTQMLAHLYLIALIVVGNAIYFVSRNKPPTLPATNVAEPAIPQSGPATIKVAAFLVLVMGLLLLRSAFTGTGVIKIGPQTVIVNGQEKVREVVVDRSTPLSDTVHIHWKRTVGLWVAGFCTLAVLSFLWGDNPLYKSVESLYIGASAGYWLVLSFWSEIVPKLYGKLLPGLAKKTFLPGLIEQSPDWWALVPLTLSILLLMRLAPKGKWLANWSTAFVIGTTAGLKLPTTFESDFMRQVQSTMLPLVLPNAAGGIDWLSSLRNMVMVVGVLSCLTYFFFSLEHKGAVGRVARLGVWFLMITFGASFALTVMGRVTLLIARFEFLFGDWLGLIGG